MSAPVVTSVAPSSAAARAGVQPGDQVLRMNGCVPRDVIEWQVLADEAAVDLEMLRGGLEMPIEVRKRAGEPLGAEVASAVFDRVRTCDNHCPFCFIYQLPKGMRRSLYVKDDDYRLSFLYGNFTTLTRFTEADLERVVTERLSPLHVSIHATDPAVRSRLLRNARGGMSLRWLRALLDNGITVHGQIVVCPGVNDGPVLEQTLAGVLDRYPELDSLAVVPLGISRFNTEAEMRQHTDDEAVAVLDTVDEWQQIYSSVLGRRLVHASDEYYLMTGRVFPAAEAYEGFPLHEDGVGMAALFAQEWHGEHAPERAGLASVGGGFFAAVDGAPAEGYRALRTMGGASGAVPSTPVLIRRRDVPTAVITGEFGAPVIEPLVGSLGRDGVRVLPVRNEFFGGTTAVTGLLVGADIARALSCEPADHRYLLPDVCLTEGRFLDGSTPEDLPRPVEIVATDGASLRRALERV